MLVLFYELYLTKQIQFQFNQIDILRQIVKQEKNQQNLSISIKIISAFFEQNLYK